MKDFHFLHAAPGHGEEKARKAPAKILKNLANHILSGASPELQDASLDTNLNHTTFSLSLRYSSPDADPSFLLPPPPKHTPDEQLELNRLIKRMKNYEI